MAIISRREHACSAAGECLAETAEEGGAEASTATEGQILFPKIFVARFSLRVHCTSVHNLCSLLSGTLD